MKKFFLILIFVYNCFYAQQDTVVSKFNWVNIGIGVNYTETDNNGMDIFIGFGGWSVKQEWANNWCSNLYFEKLNYLGIKYIYSVKGPDTPCYAEKEIDNLKLAKNLLFLLKNQQGPNTNRIIVAAHSSGAFVAHQLFQILYGNQKLDSLNITSPKIIYFNLDGGIGGGDCGFEINQVIADKLAKIYAVYAYDDSIKIYSPNYDDMVLLGSMFNPKSESIEINVSGCGCSAKWCVHDALINRAPFKPASFDLKNDYNNINQTHPVQTDYLDLLIK
ncbi:MAG: hypothetical protein V1773_17090 [bacterium]